MKLLKKLLAALISLLIVTSLILWALAKSINPETVKNYLSTELSALTQMNSRVDGDISWQVFPRPGIKMTKIKIGEENGSSPYSLSLDNLSFNLKVTPLIRGKLIFNEILVDGFKININPDLSSPSLKAKAPTANETAKTNVADHFAIERFLLSHGQIVIRQNDQKITLSGLQVGAEQFNLQKRLFPLQFKTTVEIIKAQEKILKAQVNFTGSTSFSASFFLAPLNSVQNTTLEGQLSLQNIRFNHLKITKIQAHTKTKPGILLLNPLTLKLYDGESVGELVYEFATKKLIINQTATNIDSSKFGYDLLQKDLVKGSLDFSVHSQTNLQKTNWQENTTGDGNLTIKDGTIESINLDKIIDETSLKINKLLADQQDMNQVLGLGQLDNPDFFKGGSNFKLLSFQYRLQDAKLESNSLVLQTDKLQLKGEGSLNLHDNDLNSRFFAKLILNDNNLDKVQQLFGGSFPFLIKGSLSKLEVLPDLQKINPVLSKIWLHETLTKPVKTIITKPVKTIGKTLETIIQNGKPQL